MYNFIRNHHHLYLHTPFYRRFVYLSWLYVTFSILTTLVSVNFNIKAQVMDWQSNLPVLKDFLYGIGTALSPPLIMLVLLIVLVDLTFKHNLVAKFSLVVIVIVSLLNSVAAIFQPIQTQPIPAVVFLSLHLVMIILPLVIAWMAADVFITRTTSVMP